MNYYPLSNRVIGKMKKKGEKKTDAGIIIPSDVNQNPYNEVEIVAVGRGYVSQTGNIVEMETKIGDTVLLINMTPFVLPKENNSELQNDEQYVIFQESDIFCKIKKE